MPSARQYPGTVKGTASGGSTVHLERETAEHYLVRTFLRQGVGSAYVPPKMSELPKVPWHTSCTGGATASGSWALSAPRTASSAPRGSSGSATGEPVSTA